jgi:uncharacterized Zn-binding protein involved in type VI secretion
MSNVIRDQDRSDHGGYIIASQNLVSDGGKAICVNGDIHVCPIPHHGRTEVTGTSRITIEGKEIVLEGNTAGCGASMQASQDKVSTS